MNNCLLSEKAAEDQREVRAVAVSFNVQAADKWCPETRPRSPLEESPLLITH
jgi:hypothetical protein